MKGLASRLRQSAFVPSTPGRAAFESVHGLFTARRADEYRSPEHGGSFHRPPVAAIQLSATAVSCATVVHGRAGAATAKQRNSILPAYAK